MKPEDNPKVKKIIKNLHDEMREMLDGKFLGAQINGTVEEIKRTTLKFITTYLDKYGNPEDKDQIKLAVINPIHDEINIIPQNLYTLLLLNGHYIPYHMVKGKTRYATPMAIFVYENDRASYIPVKPL